jgi:hypothetical protein
MAWTTGKCVGDKYSLHGNIVGTKGMREVVGARIQQLPSSQIALPSPTWSSMNEEMMAEVEEGARNCEDIPNPDSFIDNSARSDRSFYRI